MGILFTQPLAEGTPVPHFHLSDQRGAWHTHSELLGHPTVIWFYPKDDTPG